MAQKLFVKMTGPDGQSDLKEVNVIRSWQESSGSQIYLHTNGVYGYKDGSPVKNIREFDIIGHPVQKKAAIAWWERAGKKMSEEYYKKQEEAIEKSIGEIPVIEGDSSNLDSAQYSRRLVSDRSKKAWSEPNTWFEWFDTRPDWWGYAAIIEIGNYRYKKIDIEDESIGSNIDEDDPEETGF